MNRVHGEAVKRRVVLYESNVKFVDIRIGRVLVSAREPEGVGWAPGDGTYKYCVPILPHGVVRRGLTSCPYHK